jgi:hypothetical protein
MAHHRAAPDREYDRLAREVAGTSPTMPQAMSAAGGGLHTPNPHAPNPLDTGHPQGRILPTTLILRRNRMRRSLLGLLTVVAIASLLITAGCERSATLRVFSINGGNTLRVDLTDFYVYFDKIDSDYVTLVQVNPDSVPVVLQYVEIGAGLPTWTPYEALINKATVSFKSKLAIDEPPTYSTVTIPMQQSVMADQTGKTKTSFWMTPIPATWKSLIFADFLNEDDPYFIDIVDLAEGTITFTGYDSVANRDVKAAGSFEVEFGNFYDDPTRFGK